MTRISKPAALAAATLLALLTIPVQAAADPNALDCRTYPAQVRFESLCFMLVTAHAWYHCSLAIAGDGPGTAINIAAFMVANAGPMLQDVKCTVADGVNHDIQWWNAVWLANGRPVFCLAWGPSPEACPTSPDGVRVETMQYAVCVLTPGRLPTQCALPSYPAPATPVVPGPPPYP